MFNRILLAIDETDSADEAVCYTTALARQTGATVRVVHVNELLVGGRGVAVKTELEAMDVVDRAVARFRSAGVDADGVHFLADCFTTPVRIAEAALEWGADVTVFGSHRRRWLSRLAGRGLRERVIALSGLPTLVAPAPLKVSRNLDLAELAEPVEVAAAASSLS